MGSDYDELRKSSEDATDRVQVPHGYGGAAVFIDTQPALLTAVRGLRRRLNRVNRIASSTSPRPESDCHNLRPQNGDAAGESAFGSFAQIASPGSGAGVNQQQPDRSRRRP